MTTTTPTKSSLNIFDELKIEFVEFWWKPTELETAIGPCKNCTYNDDLKSHKEAVVELINAVLLDPRVHEHKTLSGADGCLYLEEGMVRFLGYADFEDGKSNQHATLHSVFD